MRGKTCPLEDCCSQFDKGAHGFCMKDSEDIFDCFNDIEKNQFRLKDLLQMKI